MQIKEAQTVAKEAAKLKARETILGLTLYTMPEFQPTWFHKSLYKQLQRFAEGEVRKMMVFIPPQHGKTEAATKRMTAHLLGKNPHLKVAIVSYNSPMARKFNREIQRIIDTDEYKELYPNTRLNLKNIQAVSGAYLRNADECEIVGCRGGFKTVGVGGALTGSRVDVLIIDDVYKDAADAWSSTVRANINDWYDTVAETRLHNDSKQLIVFTRWHEDDLAGRILSQDNTWEVVKYEAIKTGEPNDIDPRKAGEALWEERHSMSVLLERQKKNPYAFESLYQQNPSPKGGNYIKGEWFPIIESALFPEIQLDIWVDGAYTKSTNNDPSGIMTVGKHGNKLYVKNFYEARYEMPELLELIKDIALSNSLKHNSRIFIEPKSSGKSLVQMLRRDGFNAVEIESKLVSQGKEARIHTAVPSAHAGNVILEKGNWNKEFIHQLEAFPGAKHDEAVDLLGYAIDFHYLTQRETIMPRFHNRNLSAV